MRELGVKHEINYMSDKKTWLVFSGLSSLSVIQGKEIREICISSFCLNHFTIYIPAYRNNSLRQGIMIFVIE